MAGFGLANGSMFSNTGGEGDKESRSEDILGSVYQCSFRHFTIGSTAAINHHKNPLNSRPRMRLSGAATKFEECQP